MPDSLSLAQLDGSNTHFDSVPYSALPNTQVAPAGFDGDRPYWLFGPSPEAAYKVYGLVETPRGRYAGVSAQGYSWSAQLGLQPFHSPELMTESPYATPTSQQGGGSLVLPLDSDGIITGTASGDGGPGTGAAPPPSSLFSSDEGVPKWIIVLGLVLLAMLVLKDER